jgi:hypothetical protein
MNSELDYFKFYKTLPEKEVYDIRTTNSALLENLP